MNENYLLSVIIVSYKNKAVICDCLDSISKWNDIGDRLQIIVVEQSPETTIYDHLREAYRQQNVVVLRRENRGFGAGNNEGAKEACGKYLLFLNPDTILVEPVFQFAVDQFDQSEKLGIFGVKLIAKDGTDNLSYNFRVNFGFAFIMKRKIPAMMRFRAKKMYTSGADLFIRNDLFHQIGGFDEKIFMYGEETDLCIRIEQAGYELNYFDFKRIIHLEGASTQYKSDVYMKLCQSFIYLSQKHHRPYLHYLQSEQLYYQIKLLLKIYRTDADRQILLDRVAILTEVLEGA